MKEENSLTIAWNRNKHFTATNHSSKVLPVPFPVLLPVYFPLLDLDGSRFDTSVLNTVNSLSSFTNACGKVRILKWQFFLFMRFEMTKNAVSYGFMSDFLIDTLILTKNLFIDRDIKDIKDPKNDSPNSIFKNFQYFDSKFHFLNFWFCWNALASENPSPKENYHSVNCKCSIDFVVPFALKNVSKLAYYVMNMLRNDITFKTELQKLLLEIVRPNLTY